MFIFDIFDIVSSDLCLMLSNLRAVESVSQSAKNIYQMFKGGGGFKGDLDNVKKMQDWWSWRGTSPKESIRYPFYSSYAHSVLKRKFSSILNFGRNSILSKCFQFGTK